MSKLLPLALFFTVFGVLSCTQREVLETKQSSYSFGKQWAPQAGDVDEMQSKFASGFELKDGRAVASGDKKVPFTKEEYKGASQDLAKSTFRDSNKDSNLKKSLFGGDKQYKVKTFDSGNPARESGSVSPYATKDAGMNKTFNTDEFADRNKSYNTPNAKEGDKLFSFGRDGREAQMSSDAQRTRAQPSVDQQGNSTTDMSVDEVRRMLNPGAE